jgi:hypothetical protein
MADHTRPRRRPRRKAAVSELNTTLDLGLTARELASIPARRTTIDCERWGVMWHGAGSVDIDGGTIVNTRQATCLDKGKQVAIAVDGSQGAQLHPRNGILFQLMEDDDPGPQMVNGKLLNTGIYTEPTGDPVKKDTFDVTAVNAADAVASYTDIDLKGDFYNGVRGGAAGDGGPFGGLQGKNLVLNLADTNLTGVVSASRTAHAVGTITAADYRQLGEVTNTVGPVINNGVIVNVDAGSKWTVTGTSHLSKLSVATGAAVTAPSRRTVSMTVDGVATPIVPGTTYTGAIVLTVG